MKVKKYMLGKLLAVGVKKLAEGDFGATPAHVYWFLAGKKTWTAIVLAGVAGALWAAEQMQICQPCGDYAGTVVTLSLILTPLGLYDAAIRIEPPQRPTDTVKR
jgi:hypothetical protein